MYTQRYDKLTFIEKFSSIPEKLLALVFCFGFF